MKDREEYIGILEQTNAELKSKLELYENGVYFSSEIDEKDKEIDKLKEENAELKKQMKIEVMDKSKIIELRKRKPSKGYVFKLKIKLKNTSINEIQQSLVKQLKSGILIYPSEVLELIDIYHLEIKNNTKKNSKKYQV